ncbi:DMT family transporter [Sphingomonas sp. FW199]|uniref:DMT family transporter n=1 Tax=Sphingomonas sp. FW199 TaxID=3400217 RepID=UPI003CF2E60E
MHPQPPAESVSAPQEEVAAPAASTGAGPLLALIASNILLAFGPLFVRLADTGPVASAFWRISLAVPVLFAIAAWRGRGWLGEVPRLWSILMVSGIAFAADLAAWHLGILKTFMANATLFGNSTTLFFPIYGFIVLRAWPSRAQAAALAMAMVGAALLLGRSAQLSADNILGDLLCLLAGLLYTVYFILMARVRERLDAVPALALSSLMSAAPLLIFAILLGERIWPGDWTPLIALALCSQILGQSLIIYALHHVSPLVVGIALLTQPVVGGVTGWLLFGERLGVLDLIGALLVAAALVLVRRGPALAK